jgi:hypothetical protein
LQIKYPLSGVPYYYFKGRKKKEKKKEEQGKRLDFRIPIKFIRQKE